MDKRLHLSDRGHGHNLDPMIGFLVIEVEELFALAYIFTTFVTFQGIFIFVLLSKQVRENYIC